uniref:G-protein coupled receptors family 1 profile domain-containing protein n=1 Tax=Anopheles epiroticus TaxID=199890 RepID=A0A182PM96_9DIPT
MDDDYTSFEDYLSNEVYLTHSSEVEDAISNKTRHELPLPDLTELVILYAFNTVIVAAGIVLNLVLVKGIVGAKASGALLFVLQIAFIDVLTLLTSNWELYYSIRRTWIFSYVHCTLYSGFESFTSVAIVYFIIGLNFHSISSYNLAVDLAKHALAIPEVESATESLTEENNYEVATDSISQKRSLTIDYRYKKRRISVRLPILLVWFIAASESLPLFLFADIETIARADRAEQPAIQYCTDLPNTVANHNIVSIMVIIIRIILPTVTLVITLAQTVVKFYRGKHFTQPDEIEENVAFSLKLSMFLSISYICFNSQRLYGSLLQEIVLQPSIVPKYPSFSSAVGISLAVLHFSASFIRPLVLIIMCKQKINNVEITFTCQKRSENNGISMQ